LLVLENVSVHYGRAIALASVNMEIKEGEFVAVIGANGAGKSTLLRAISGLVELERGKITLNDELLVESTKSEFRNMGRNKSLDPHEIVKRGIIHCPERRRLFHDSTVEENLLLGAYTYKEDKDAVKEELEKVLKLFPVLADRLSEKAGNFSGGQQQMIAVARSLMGKPKILMLDEPSLGLAPLIKEDIVNKIKEIQKQGVTTLLIEQDASIALSIADRAYLLEDGAIDRKGTCTEFLNDSYIKESYLGLM